MKGYAMNPISPNDIQRDIYEVRSHLSRMIELYQENRIDEAGNQIKNIFSKILNSLLRCSGLASSKKATEKINDLYQYKIITDEENNHLHNLRKMRNLFVHDDDTEMSENYEDQEKLEQYMNNFQMCINFCTKDVEWFEKKIIDVYNGVRVENSCPDPSAQQSAANGRKGAKPKVPKDKSFAVLAPVIVSVILSGAVVYFLRDIFMKVISDDFVSASVYDKPFVTSFACIAGILLIGGILFHELMPQVVTAAVMGSLAHIAARSDLCTFLMIVLAVLVTTRYVSRFRTLLFWAFYVIWLALFSFLAYKFLGHFFITENSPGADMNMKVVLPIIAYWLLFFIGHSIVNKHFRPFRKTLGNNRLPMNTLLSLGIACVVVVLLYGAFHEISDKNMQDSDVALKTMAIGTIISGFFYMFISYLICCIVEHKDEV